MRIGIYAKWMETLGGGEKVATVMAETLADSGNKVDLISTFKITKKEIERKMAVDLSKVTMVAWEERSYARLEAKTRKYDLFINTTFLDHQENLAKKSIYYVHFPSPIRRTLLGLVKYEALIPF